MYLTIKHVFDAVEWQLFFTEARRLP